MGGLAVDQDAFLKKGNNFGNSHELREIHDFGIKWADARGVDDSGLPSLENFFHLPRGELIGDGAGHASGHDLAFEGPVIEIFKVTAKDAEHKLDA